MYIKHEYQLCVYIFDRIVDNSQYRKMKAFTKKRDEGEKMNKPKLYLDMDNVLVDTLPVLNAYAQEHPDAGKPDRIPGIFADLPIKDGVTTAIKCLEPYFDLYILSTAPWHNPSAWQDKMIWLEKHFGEGELNPFYKKVIMTHDKGLVHKSGGILVDDRPYHGASAWSDDESGSVWIQYGYKKELTWETDLVPYLIDISTTYGQMMKPNLIQAVQTADTITGEIHGDLVSFEKENWE